MALKKQHLYMVKTRCLSVSRILENWDVASLYANLVRIYGYSSRNQKDNKAYIDLLEMRIKAKHGELTEEFLGPLNLTNDDLKSGLKLPLNAYTGTLRAPFNPLYDNLQGFSICSTGQMLLLQLAHDLKEVPTVEITELNTDAVMYEIDEEYVEQAHKVLQDWQDLTGLELEQDKIKKLIMRDVNNYVEIVQTGDNDYEVHYKGGEFRGNHIFKWDKDNKVFKYSFKDDLENNSLTIVSEAIIKNLLFNIPVEDTINNCNDIFRFQMISHLGHTYKKCVLKNKDGSEIELQRNNRIYAGLEKTGGKIYKVKPDGRYDSLANCPLNPIVDNKNDVTIDKINKKWYINYTLQKISEFKGRKEIYMDEKLDKLKKDELIEMVKNLKEGVETSTEQNAEIIDPWQKNRISLLQKINNFRQDIRKRNFILDKELPKNLGNGEIYSIDQIYQAVQETAIKNRLDFAFEVVELERLDLDAFKPMTGAPQHISTIKCMITFTDIDTGLDKTYQMISQGSDSIDKSVNGASSYAFRNWFNKNFTPCIINGEKITFGEGSNDFSVDAMEIEEPKSVVKTPTFVPAEKKEEIVKEITTNNSAEVTTTQNNDSDVDTLTNLIYEYRELSGNEEAGASKLESIINKNYTDMDLLKWTLDFKNAVNDLKKGN